MQQQLQQLGSPAFGRVTTSSGPPAPPGTADSVMLDPQALGQQQEDALLSWLQADDAPFPDPQDCAMLGLGDV
jgi:hypothetical protein